MIASVPSFFTGTLGQDAHSDGQTTTLRKEGPGTMRISAANYFPRLHVTGGVLIANHDQALGVTRVKLHEADFIE